LRIRFIVDVSFHFVRLRGSSDWHTVRCAAGRGR
jgi:hypothetical protein